MEDTCEPWYADSPSSEGEGIDRATSRNDVRTPMITSPFGRIVTMNPFSSSATNVTPMTPSPNQTPHANRECLPFTTVSLNPGTAPTTAPVPKSSPTSPSNGSSVWKDVTFSELQQGYLSHACESSPTNFRSHSRALFRDTPQSTQTSRRRRSRNDRHTPGSSFSARKFGRTTRLQQSLLLDGTPLVPLGMSERRRSKGRYTPSTFSTASSTSSQPPEPAEVSPDSSPRSATSEHSATCRARKSPTGVYAAPPFPQAAESKRCNLLALALFLAAVLSLSMDCITSNSLGLNDTTAGSLERTLYHPHARPVVTQSASGLRGKMVQTAGRHASDEDQVAQKRKPRKTEEKDKKEKKTLKTDQSTEGQSNEKSKTSLILSKKKKIKKDAHDPNMMPRGVQSSSSETSNLAIHLPPKINLPIKKRFEDIDQNLYRTTGKGQHRVVYLDETLSHALPTYRSIKKYAADFTDNTQLYSLYDSSDERLSKMELREPYVQGECVPMQDWQTTFHPSCNGMHELAVENLGEEGGNDVNLFGTKGYWRNAWRLDLQRGSNDPNDRDTVVLKTLKFQHNFEDAHFEHDRIDAVAMERLTSSPHVINAFGFCGHSVLTEFGDGSRVGELADKARKKPLARLTIARDIANGLADVHGIDGDGNATFVHLDINPANVVSINGTLKLNDFNIGIIRRWNTTSQQPCGFPAQYPNPQWRSPEEARNEQNLTEKVDIFSMGHIFFRLICGHEPWNKLEPGGRPSKEAVNKKVEKGILPYIPESVRNTNDQEVIAIREAMLQCYTFDPAKRPSARDIARKLDKELEKLTLKQTQNS